MKRTLKDILLLLSAAVLSVAGFQPLGLWYLSFLGPVLLLHVLDRSGGGFRKGYLYGFFYSIVLVHWLAFNSGAAVWMVTISMFAAAAFLALNFGAVAWLYALVRRRRPGLALAAFPFIWTSVEYIRSFGALGFPWIAIGNTQSPNLLYIQMADIGSVYLVSFFLISTSVLVYVLLKGTDISRYILAGLILALLLPYCYGTVRWQQNDGNGRYLSVRVIQPNYDSHEKWKRSNRERLFDDMLRLSRTGGFDDIDLILWPESATPMYIRNNRGYRKMLEDLVDESGKILLTGTPDLRLENGKVISPLNSLVAFEPGKGITSSYDKTHLVPFGEYIPLSEIWPSLNELNLGQGNFLHGEKDQIFIIADSLVLAPIVCYESIFPQPIARAVKNGAAAVMNVSNDSWFGRSWGPHQHASQAVFRAVETRRPFFRSANTGISLGLDTRGRIIDSIPLYVQGVIDIRTELSDKMTFYVRHGDFFSIAVLLVTLCCIAVSVLPFSRSS